MTYYAYFVERGNLTVTYFLPARVPEQIVDAFKENLAKCSWAYQSPEQCITNCIESIKGALQPSDYELSDASKQGIDAHVDNFNKAVEETSLLTLDQMEKLKCDFKRSLGAAIREKWASIVAKSFYPIPLITDENGRIKAAQKWTHQFYVGLEYVFKYSDGDVRMSHAMIQPIIKAVVEELRIYFHDEIQKRDQNMIKRKENHPEAFDATAKNGTADCNNEHDKFMVMNWSKINTNLRKSIWNGYTLKDVNKSILESPISLLLFTKIFQKKE